ncbi:MAG TPA: penicillin-binding protein 2 [Longimicrobiaceae bacterium]|nr:penicillin-binding protein 2 [Longimicrobiaceae bacterium]
MPPLPHSVYGRVVGAPASPFHPHARQRRAFLATMVIAAMLCTLGAAFFRTQVIRNSEFTLRSEDNRFRMVPIAAPRGTVYDRNGKVVAETVTGYTLSLEPGQPDSVRSRLAALVPVLELDTTAVREVLERARKHRDEPVVVSDALTFRQLSRLQEQPERPAGMLLEARPLRRYPYGDAIAHIVGYVGEISERELASDDWRGYKMGQDVGKAGVEREYERVVGGTPGARFIEVDARGRVVGRFAEQLTRAPRTGGDLRLTIDAELQQYVRAVFPAGMKGAVVAMVPSTGEILALYSAPTYDPNLLVGRIAPKVWRELNGPDRPLLNRAINGTYPPGSTWKLATAIIGLERGVITPEQKMPIACTGGMSYAGRYSRCWQSAGHGPQDVIQAIANSCNVYFYQLGTRLGIKLLTQEGTRLGFARRTSVDLPGEKVGTFPASREWYKKRFGWTPPPSEVMNLSIGQGPNAQTPIRMAQFFSALAGDGTAAAPHIVARSEEGPPETDLRLSPRTLAALHQGMARVVEAGGTAHAVELRRWKLYGKTGTSQNSADAKRPHAWFTGFAGPRGGAPEVVVAVVVEFGESGSGAAAPVAARIADYYLNKKHGHPVPRIEDVEPTNAPKPPSAPRRRAAPRTLPERPANALPEVRLSGPVAAPGVMGTRDE